MHFKNTPVIISEAIYTVWWINILHLHRMDICTLLFKEFTREQNSVSEHTRTEQQNSGVSAITHLNASDWPLP